MVIALCGGGALSGDGLLISQRLFTHSVRRSHNSVVGYIRGIVGGIYSVLLAFIAVAARQNFGLAEHLVETEAHDRVA
jgi:ABC-type enterobactin transport system permease subunit